MSQEATDAFSRELVGLIEKYRHDWEMTYGECIGVLEIVKHDILEEACEQEESED